jgi:hypothetical protein
MQRLFPQNVSEATNWQRLHENPTMHSCKDSLSGNIQGTFREHSGNIQGTLDCEPLQPKLLINRRHLMGSEKGHIGNIQGTFREHLRNIQGTIRKHWIQGTYREPLGNIQGTFREHLRNI